MRVNGSRHGLKAPMTLDPFHQPAQPIFHTMARRHQPARAFPMETCPGLRSGMRLRAFRARRLTHPFRVLAIPAPRIRLSRDRKHAPYPGYGGGNPRTKISRKNANRDTTTYVHTATPLRLSGESTPRTPIRRRNPEGCVRCQFSYLGVPVPAGMSDCYENRLQTSTRRPHFVFPAKAGIQRGGRCGTHGTQTFPPTNPYEVSPPANPAKL